MTEHKEAIITLVGLKQAKQGFSFIHNGALNECKKCEFFRVCMGKLEVERVYVVTEIRDKVLPCMVHEEGVQVVVVEERNIETNIERRFAFTGGIITFQPQTCEEELCPNFEKCVPQGLKTGDKCKILKVNRQMAVICPLKRHLVSSILQRVVE